MICVKERTSLVDCRGRRGGFLSRKVCGGFWILEGECRADMIVVAFGSIDGCAAIARARAYLELNKKIILGGLCARTDNVDGM